MHANGQSLPLMKLTSSQMCSTFSLHSPEPLVIYTMTNRIVEPLKLASCALQSIPERPLHFAFPCPRLPTPCDFAWLCWCGLTFPLPKLWTGLLLRPPELGHSAHRRYLFPGPVRRSTVVEPITPNHDMRSAAIPETQMVCLYHSESTTINCCIIRSFSVPSRSVSVLPLVTLDFVRSLRYGSALVLLTWLCCCSCLQQYLCFVLYSFNICSSLRKHRFQSFSFLPLCDMLFDICHLPSAQLTWQNGQNGLISRKLVGWVLTLSSTSSPATSFPSPVRWHCLRLPNVGFHFETVSILHVLRLKKNSEPTAELCYTTVAVYVLCSLFLCQGFDTCKATTEDRASIASY